jgi:uncharacterized small protein (DUF1192 family)
MPDAEVLPPDRDTVTLRAPAPDAPYVYVGLDDQTFHITLSGFVQQVQGQYAECGLTLYYRILPGLEDAERRFRDNDGDPTYTLEGCKGIEEYIKELGLKPATIRKWRQRDKERRFMREVKLLTGESAPCGECGKEKGHKPTCSSYVKPEPEALTALESKFVDASLKQHAAVQDFYAGRIDAEGALKAIVATLPDHNKLEEYVERGSDAVETDKNVDEQQLCVSELGERISHQDEEIAKLRAENENLRQRLEALNAVPENLRDVNVTATLAAEPDTFQAGERLTAYLTTVGERVLPPGMALGMVSATVTLAGRDHRIMPGDFLERPDKDGAPTLCKCVGIAEFMKRRRVQEWREEKWQKDRVISSEHETEFRVITEEKARLLVPEAFPPSQANPSEGL